MFDNSVVIKRPDGSFLIRGEHCGGVEDIIVQQYPDGDILIRDIGDDEAVIIQPRQLNAVISILDLLDEEEGEEDEEFEDELEWLRDAYEDGEIALTEEEREMLMDDEDFIDDEDVAEFMRSAFDPFDYMDGEMDEYVV